MRLLEGANILNDQESAADLFGNPIADAGEDALLKSRARLVAFLENSPDAIFIKDAHGRYTAVSRSFLELADRTLDEVLGRTDHDLFGPEIAAAFGSEDDEVRSAGKPLLFEESFPYAGNTLSFLTRKFPLPFGEVAGIASNVTETKARQQAHDRLAERLRVAVEGTGIGFYENNFTTGESVWSESAFRVLCLEPTSDLKGSFELWRSRVHPDDLDRVEAEHRAAVARGGPWSIQYRVIDPASEEVRWVLAHTQFSHRDDGVYSTGIAVDITEQKQLEEQQALLLSELNHRVKNTLAVVQSIAAQTFTAGGNSLEQRRAFEARLVALAGVHHLLQQDSTQRIGIHSIVEKALGPFQRGDPPAIRWEGEEAELESRKCVSLALALHELCTNAVKYGALANNGGKVDVRWTCNGGVLDFEWRESGGPPVETPTRVGFGTKMLERALSRELGTGITLDFAPEGVCCRFRAKV